MNEDLFQCLFISSVSLSLAQTVTAFGLHNVFNNMKALLITAILVNSL